jgi:hypothetical protein
MEAPGSLSPQKVAVYRAVLQLRRLHANDDPLLNYVLAAAREHGWSTPVLARALDTDPPTKPPAVGKRIERARRVMRESQTPPDLTSMSPEEAERAKRRHEDQLRLQRRLSELKIPDAPKVQAMIDGKQLTDAEIVALARKQRVASKVNGALPAGHPKRQVSEDFSAELNDLVEKRHFSPYYLARVLGVSHRAITSRLERHHFRKPCPSVAGTASGVYFGRKIGDPGTGAPRLNRVQRAELRTLWHASQDMETPPAGRRRATADLALALHGHLKDKFTLANLAQAMSTKDAKVRSADLQRVLDTALAGAA